MKNIKNIIAVSFCFYIPSLFACLAGAPRAINMAIDLTQKTTTYYNNLKLYREKPKIAVQQCLETVKNKKFLMIGIGVENNILSTQYSRYSLNDTNSAAGDTCQLLNTPYATETPAERNKVLFAKRNFINKCIIFQAIDLSEAGITFPKKQPGCQITRISKNSINFRGEVCFIKPHIDSDIGINVEVDPRCYNPQFLKENNIQLQDVLGQIGVYIAGDASGRSVDLKALSQTIFRFSINPIASLIAVSENYSGEQPVWPTEWQGGEVHLGQLEIDGSLPKSDHLDLPLVVKNQCPRVCNEQLCTSNCNYSLPVVAEFTLYELMPNGKKEYLRSWFDGGVAPQRWQGVVYGIGIELNKNVLEQGHTYQIEATISEPDYNFTMFDGRLEKLIQLQNNHIDEIHRSGDSINEIPIINNIEELDRLPSLPEYSGIHFDGGLNQYIKRAIANMESYLRNVFWPPIYTKMCTSNQECVTTSANTIYLSYTFELGELQKNKKYQIKNLTYERHTPWGEAIVTDDYQAPTVKCATDVEDDNSDEFDGEIDFNF